ncbi:MAG: hypothetical protein AMJ81_09925 [Phycisphaerae bacterium SM23_33]|nr:MAG: hypothetical protein AMJ81_09925 [Phycisphaerae bacterium SM23_33]
MLAYLAIGGRLLRKADGGCRPEASQEFPLQEAYELANPAPGAFAEMVVAHAAPEPSSMMLLAAGVAGLRLWRRKRTLHVEDLKRPRRAV